MLQFLVTLLLITIPAILAVFAGMFLSQDRLPPLR
jgi:hypothetical protein